MLRELFHSRRVKPLQRVSLVRTYVNVKIPGNIFEIVFQIHCVQTNVIVQR